MSSLLIVLQRNVEPGDVSFGQCFYIRFDVFDLQSDVWSFWLKSDVICFQEQIWCFDYDSMRTKQIYTRVNGVNPFDICVPRRMETFFLKVNPQSKENAPKFLKKIWLARRKNLISRVLGWRENTFQQVAYSDWQCWHLCSVYPDAFVQWWEVAENARFVLFFL